MTACMTSPTSEREGRRHDEFGRAETEDRAAIADRRQREHRRPRRGPTASVCMPPTMPPGLVDMITTPAVATTIAIIIGQSLLSPRKIKPEDRDLDRLGLHIGDGDDERALAHGDEHQRRRRDLRRERRRAPTARMPSRSAAAARRSTASDRRERPARTESRTGTAHASRRACRACRSVRAASHCARFARPRR